MSFEALQERLSALQETTTQVRELIDRLSKLDIQPGSVPPPQGDGDEDDENVATELSGEINQILREEEEDLELLAEEITDLRGGKEGSDAARRKERLRETMCRLDGDVKRYAARRPPPGCRCAGALRSGMLTSSCPAAPASPSIRPSSRRGAPSTPRAGWSAISFCGRTRARPRPHHPAAAPARPRRDPAPAVATRTRPPRGTRTLWPRRHRT